jgi:catechol 2,3-dioxygenase-like lactoylglutathione lyase family enzyme
MKTQTKNDLDFNHVMIYTKDVAQSLRFYQGLLKFKLIEKYGHDYARLQSPKGKTTIALHKTKDKNVGRRRAKDIVLYFETKDLDKLCATLVRHGAKFSQLPKIMEWGWKHAYLKDPDGHEISLYWAGRKRFEKTPQ